MIKISVIILNFNGFENTIECIGSLLQGKNVNYALNLIVVDNSSTDNSYVNIHKKFPKIQFIKNKENLGYAQGNNMGIELALNQGADFIFILNNDTKVAIDCVQELLNFALIQKNGGIFSPKIYFYPGMETHTKKYQLQDLGKIFWYAGGKIDWNNMLASHRGVDELDRGQYNDPQKTPFVSGCAMFVRRELFESIGLFDNKLFLYYEDVDLCLKAKNKKYDIWYVPKAIIWHKNAHSTGGTGSDLQIYYQTRNRLFIGTKYASLRTKFALFKEAGKVIFSGNDIQKQAVKDFLTNKYGKRQ